MRVSEYFNLNRNQPYLDFVDVYLDTDIPVFLNPAAIRVLPSAWGSDCVSLLQHFFETLLISIKSNDEAKAIALLSSLNERNEFHFGFSQGKSRGHGFGAKSGGHVWKALSNSKAAKSGLLQDLEDTCLLVEGIGPDMISDAICNIIRGPLIHYTQHMCDFYGIPLTPNVDSGPIWNPVNGRWENKLIDLPITEYGKLMLVPKLIVRFGMWYSVDEYYRYYLLPEMERDEIKANTGLVETLKDGRKKVTKKKLKEKYGTGKKAVIEQTIVYPSLLHEYKQYKEKTAPKPLSHGDFAEIEKSENPDWNTLVNEIVSLPTGNAEAYKYEDAIEKLLTALFYPSLCSPQKQNALHKGRKRVDITYVNAGQQGFFDWLSKHYPSGHIFVECKNYGSEIGNPEIDQLSGRFSPSRGKVGILICRKIKDKNLLLQRCIDTAHDDRGFIIALDDEDITTLVDENLKISEHENYPLLRRYFNKLIM